jgi:hypothetical protein
MYRSVRVWVALCLVWALAACGGGGGDGGGGGSSPAALSFSPAVLTANIETGVSATLTVRATVADPSAFDSDLYIYIVDSQQVLTGDVEISAIDDRTFAVTLHTSATLGVGRYQDRLEIHLCKDARCKAEYPGSPASLPYDLTVAAALSFSPPVLTANVEAGVSTTLTVRATVANPSAFDSDVYAYVVDSREVLAGDVELSAIDDRTFAVTLHTSATLGVGRYQGRLEIQLCKDARCQAQYPGLLAFLPYDLTVAAGPLRAAPSASTAATMHWGAAPPATVSVSVTGPGLAWTATTDASWLRVTGGSGNGDGSFIVSYDAAALAVGHYTGIVTVRSSDNQTVNVSFTLEVMPTQFSFLSGMPSFNAVNGTTIPAQTLNFELDNQVASPWTATTSAAWLGVAPLSGTMPATLTLQPDPARGALASGSYSADLVLSSPGIASKTVTTTLTLTPPSLSAPTTTITLGGVKGRDLAGSQSVTVSLNTGSNAWPWKLSALPPWLSANATSGTVDASGTTLVFTPNAAAVQAGANSATVTVSATVNGDTVTLPLTVNLNADQRRLLPSEWGIGLASTPTGTVLTRTLAISDNFGGTLNWSASSDSAWLTVTASGNTGAAASLTLNANPAALATGTVSTATVTVSTATAGVEPAVIRVGLWKDASGLANVTTLPQNYEVVVADKIRPYVYAHAGGTSIDVYNAYTAQKIATLGSVGAVLDQMSVSPDGSRLYALDTANRALKVIALASNVAASTVSTWNLDNAVKTSTSVLVIRPNGVEVVLVGDGTAYAAGRSLGGTGIDNGIPGYSDPGALAASSNGRRVYMQDSGISPASVAAFDVDYSEMSGGVLMVSNTTPVGFFNPAANGQDIAVSSDASRVYTAAGSPYRCSSIDGSPLAFIGSLPGGDAYPNNVEVTSDGRVICGTSHGYPSAAFWVHAPSGALLSSFKVTEYSALKARQMVVTPDGFVVVALTNDSLIAFVPIGP